MCSISQSKHFVSITKQNSPIGRPVTVNMNVKVLRDITECSFVAMHQRYRECVASIFGVKSTFLHWKRQYVFKELK